MDEAAPVVEVEGLARRFGRRWALVDVGLSLWPGECLAVFGPNGAGKTTLLRILAGLLEPTGGVARVAGFTLPGGSDARRAVGLISHHTMLYPVLTARENVSFAASLYEIPDPDRAADVALERMRVLDRANTPVRQLSRGLQQRVSIARAFVHTPQVVLLDEPFTGLDAVGAEALSDALRALMDAGAALVLVTHSLDEGLALATRTAVMRGGRLIRTDERATIDVDAFGLWYRAALA